MLGTIEGLYIRFMILFIISIGNG